MARLARLPLVWLALVLFWACSGASQRAEAPEGAAVAFLASLSRLAGGAGAAAVDGELAARLAKGVTAAVAAGNRLEMEVVPNGPPRFDVPIPGGRLMGMGVSLRMREVAPDGRVVRELREPAYDLIMRLVHGERGWVVAGVHALPWLEQGEEMGTGGCPLVSGGGHRFGRLREMRQGDVPQLPVAASELAAIEEAWRCYWLVTADALRRLDGSLLPLVSAGEQLEGLQGYLRFRQEHGIALEEEVSHRSPVLVQYTGEFATVDAWLDGRGRGVDHRSGERRGDWEYRAAHMTVRMRKTAEGWRVIGVAVVRGPGNGSGEDGR